MRNLQILAIVCFFESLMISIDLRAQRFDSLAVELLGKSKHEKLEALYQKEYDLIDVNDSLAMSYAQKTYSFAKEVGDSAILVKSGYHKALLYRRWGQYDSCLLISLKMLPIARRLNLESYLAKLLNGLLRDNLRNASFDKALKYGLECVELARKNSDEIDLGLFLNNLGLIYYKLENYDRATPYFLESYQWMFRSNHPEAELPAHNLSLSYAYELEIKNAEFFLSESRRLSKDSCSSSSLARSQFAAGLIQFKKGAFDAAKVSFNESLRHSIESGNNVYAIDNAVFLLRLNMMSNDSKNSKKLISDVQTILEERMIHRGSLMEFYYELIRFYKVYKDDASVHEYQAKYLSIRDSIYSYEATRNLMRLEVEQAESESRQKLAAQSDILRLSAQLIERQRAQNISSVLISILLFGWLLLLFRNYRIQKSNNARLERRVCERTREIELNYANTRSRLEERDLHIERMSMEVRRTVATLRGLCIVGELESSQTGNDDCLLKIRSTVDTLSDYIEKRPTAQAGMK